MAKAKMAKSEIAKSQWKKKIRKSAAYRYNAAIALCNRAAKK
jgi:hypothetical protein